MAANSIPDFESFASSMKQCADLSVLQPAAFTFLLEWVYLAAEFVIVIDRAAELARRFPAPFRSERNAFSRLRVHLEKASDDLRKASELAPRQLSETLRHLPPELQPGQLDTLPSLSRGTPNEGSAHLNREFERIATMLCAAANYAHFREFLCAEIVHPSIRTTAEKKIMSERSKSCAFPDYEEIPHISRITEKTSIRVHWFIGHVHLFLAGLKNIFGPVNKVKNEARVITQMIEVLFNETRTVDRARRELVRQRKTGIPDLIA
jgi:hypothetical protein